MTRNVYRDKEQESNVKAIADAMQLMEVPMSVGWLAPKKLEAADRLGMEKLSPTMQRGALVNMFRVMIDHGGDIKAGIKSYSATVSRSGESIRR